MKFFNTYSKRKEEFIPLVPGEVSIYNCGPTIYDYAHVGNFRAYIFADLLRRYLEYKGYCVKQIMNITDVDDKTIKNAMEQGLTLKDYTSKYKKSFFDDLEMLKINKAHHYPAATEHIPEMLEIIKKLRDNGYTYEAEGSIYYRIAKFENYGKLSGKDALGLQAGARVDVDEYVKEEARDFVLWKAYRKEDGEVYWDSEFGRGRPGWHIECSAMSMKYLGETFDIHTGGEDNIFPHHENEIAQSEAATGKQFVRYWLHCSFLLVEGQKMSKSLGNFYTMKDLIDKKIFPESIRYALLTTHYRQQLNFTFDGLKAADGAVARLNDFIHSLKNVKQEGDIPIVDDYLSMAKKSFEESLDDDLNISSAMGTVFTLVKQINRLIAAGNIGSSSAEKVIDFLRQVNKILDVLDFEEEVNSEEVEALIAQRQAARADKNYALADDIRDKLVSRGIQVADSVDGPRWKKIK